MTNIYDLTWTDPTIITTFAVCPGCNSEMMLIYEDADGRQEWHCDECWQAFDADGKRLHAVNFGGIAMRCP